MALQRRLDKIIRYFIGNRCCYPGVLQALA
jgi:hypothetical protein